MGVGKLLHACIARIIGSKARGQEGGRVQCAVCGMYLDQSWLQERHRGSACVQDEVGGLDAALAGGDWLHQGDTSASRVKGLVAAMDSLMAAMRDGGQYQVKEGDTIMLVPLAPDSDDHSVPYRVNMLVTTSAGWLWAALQEEAGGEHDGQ